MEGEVLRFSLIHPSRGRVTMAEAAILEWTGKCDDPSGCEYVLSVDAGDPALDEYRSLAARRGVGVVIGANRSVVGAVNRAAPSTGGDVMIVVSDDFGCPEHWDTALRDVIAGRRDVAVLVDDGIDGRIMTLPIVGRGLYERLGYLYYPGYLSVFADDDLTEVATREGALVDARSLLFPHRHYSVGLSPHDATYRHQNQLRAWFVGRRVFEKRRAANFGRRPRSAGLLATQLLVEVRGWSGLAVYLLRRLVSQSMSQISRSRK